MLCKLRCPHMSSIWHAPHLVLRSIDLSFTQQVNLSVLSPKVKSIQSPLFHKSWKTNLFIWLFDMSQCYDRTVIMINASVALKFYRNWTGSGGKKFQNARGVMTLSISREAHTKSAILSCWHFNTNCYPGTLYWFWGLTGDLALDLISAPNNSGLGQKLSQVGGVDLLI